MRVVLDTNVLLVCISVRSRLHWIFRALLNAEFTLCVTTEILAEYAEIIAQEMGQITSESVLGVLENLPNVVFITTYYRFNLLADEDDNKFVDCAIAANADFIVSHDRDFSVLRRIEFPKVVVISSDQFRPFVQSKST